MEYTNLEKLPKNAFNYMTEYLDLPEALALLKTNKRNMTHVKENHKLCFLYLEALEFCKEMKILKIEEFIKYNCENIDKLKLKFEEVMKLKNFR